MNPTPVLAEPFDKAGETPVEVLIDGRGLNTCYGASVHLFSEQSCVWGADDFERLVKLPNGTDPGGKFIIVQSHARIPLERVREYCLSFAG